MNKQAGFPSIPSMLRLYLSIAPTSRAKAREIWGTPYSFAR